MTRPLDLARLSRPQHVDASAGPVCIRSDVERTRNGAFVTRQSSVGVSSKTGVLRGHPLRSALIGLLALLLIVVSSLALSNSPERHRPTSAHETASSPGVVKSATTTVPGPPFSVQDATITLTDPSRATPARGDVPGHPGRTLVTIIRRPVGAPGPLPLIVFAHGWNSNPSVYEVLLDTWAAAGFLVAAPTFPDSADTLPGAPVSNYPDQARDMSFVISSLLGGIEKPVDPSRIAVAGHSDGGTD